MACQACRRRLLSIFVPELASTSRQHLPHRTGRVFTTVDSSRRHYRRAYSTPAAALQSTEEKSSVPEFTDSSNSSQTPKETSPSTTTGEETKGTFEPRLKLDIDAAFDQEHIGVEKRHPDVPTLGKNARKKLRRAREAAAQADADQSENHSVPEAVVDVTTSAEEMNPQNRSKTVIETPLSRRRRTGTAKEKVEFAASKTQKLSAKTSRGLKLPKASSKPMTTTPQNSTLPRPKKKLEPWQIQKNALKQKFGDAQWTPNKKLSPDAMDGIRALHAQYPDKFSTPVLAKHFKMSPDAIRRILKSKWTPNAEEDAARRVRWENRGARIWTRLAEKGLNPPEKWKDMGAGAGLSRTEIERGEAGKMAAKEMYKSDTEKRMKRLLEEIPDFR